MHLVGSPVLMNMRPAFASLYAHARSRGPMAARSAAQSAMLSEAPTALIVVNGTLPRMPGPATPGSVTHHPSATTIDRSPSQQRAPSRECIRYSHGSQHSVLASEPGSLRKKLLSRCASAMGCSDGIGPAHVANGVAMKAEGRKLICLVYRLCVPPRVQNLTHRVWSGDPCVRRPRKPSGNTQG